MLLLFLDNVVNVQRIPYKETKQVKRVRKSYNANNMRARTAIKSIYVANQKRYNFCCLLQFWRVKNMLKKSKVALLHSNASFLRCFVYHWRVLVNVHGLVFYGLHSWNTCFHRIRISNTCHFRVCVLVMLCPRRLLDSIVSFVLFKIIF